MAEVNQAFDSCDSDYREKRILNENECEISIAWTNLRYHVNEFERWKFKKTWILRGLNGYFQTGSLNGFLGPSGAGKTTLLNCLSGTIKSGLSENSAIYLNETTSTKSFVSYNIRQHVHESIISELTVGQILRYAFAFKNDTANGNKMQQHITATMAALMLPPDLVTRTFALCSGGEQKRVAIAQELMAMTAPSMLFLDEPTTGLDSAAAFEVMLCLQKLAKNKNITIIASIHAPNDETLNLFDQLYVLAKGGVAIYSGPPKQIKAHLEQEIKLIIPARQPPIEVLLKIACNGIQDLNVTKLATHNLTSKRNDINIHLAQLTHQPNGIPNHHKLFSVANFLTQLTRLFRITFIAKIRLQLMTAILFFVFFGILSTIYGSNMAASNGCYSLENSHNMTCNSEDKLHNDDLVKENGHYLSYVVLVVGMIVMMASQVFYMSLVKVFQSEHRNHWYSLGVFYWSSNIISFLELNLMAVIITSFTYFLSNQHAADDHTINWTRLTFYFLFIWLMCIFYQSIAQLIGIILVNHPQLAFMFAQLLYALTTLFNGLYIKPNRIGIAALESISNWIGLVYITRIAYFSIYGIDRCDFEKEYSWVLIDYNVEVEKIGEYVYKILQNVAIIKLITLIVMFLKFNNFSINRSKKQEKLENNNKIIEIDFNLKSTELNKCETKSNGAQISENEVEFKQFSTGKMLIAWRNLSLFCSNSIFEIGLKNKQRKTILCNLNGQFRFGTLNALMGTSGAGKTSLLKVLNGRCKTRLSDETEIYLSKFTAIHTCFITQEVSGHLMPGLTAKQMLIYASKLKNFPTQVDHKQIALRWLHELDLMNTVDTKVENCSGGERKRLAVALELTSIQMPNLICIDEPTSGLDTNSAEIVMSTLRKLALSHPLTIITSIHQPTTEILFMFDQLYVLARGGVCIYSGSPNQIQASLNQTSTISKATSQFPIETLIKQSCLGHQTEVVRHNDRQFFKPADLELLQQTQLTPDGVVPNRPRFSFHSVLTLSHRFLLYIRGYLWKEWLFSIINSIGYALALRFFFGPNIIYPDGCINLEDDLNSCSKSIEEIENEFLLTDNLRYNYFFTNIYMLLVVLSSSINFFYEFPYFENEHRNGWYSTGSFYLMKSLFEILPLIPTNLIYVYIIDIYDPVISTRMYWPLVFLLMIAAIGFLGMGHCFSLLSRGNLTNQTILLTGTFVLSIIIGNFYIPVANMHYIWQFLSNFSICRWLFESDMLLQYGFGRCRPKQIQAVLYSMSLTDDSYYQNIFMLFLNLILYRVIAIYLLIRTVNPIENRRKRVLRITKYREKLRQTIEKTTDNSNEQFKIELSRF